MSRVLREERARLAASLGSFVVRRSDPAFHPLGADPVNDDSDPATGHEQALLRARAEGCAEGYAEARETLEKEVAAERDAIARLAGSLEALRCEPTGPLALLLAETVDRLVRQIIGEVDIDTNLLLTRAKAAAALIGDNVEPSKLIVHPDDAGLLESAGLDVEVVGDPSLERGTVILETGHGWIEDGPAVRLQRLRAELDKMAAQR